MARRRSAAVADEVRARVEALEARRLLAAYSVLDIGTPGPDASYVNAVAWNRQGHIAGWYFLKDAGAKDENGDPISFQRAFLWADGHFTDVGTFGGDDAEVKDVNDLDQVIGVAATTTPDPEQPDAQLKVPFLYSEGELRRMQDFLPAGSPWTLVSPLNINNHGVVLATAVYDLAHKPPDDPGGGGEDGGDDPGDGGDDGSGDSGDDGGGDGEDGSGADAAVTAVRPAASAGAPELEPGDTLYVLVDLASGAVTPIEHTRYTDIFMSGALNDAGQVAYVGFDAAGNVLAYLYDHGTRTLLGDLGGGRGASFSALTEDGDVLGSAAVASPHPDYGTDFHPFLYHAGHMTELAMPAHFPSGAVTGMNASGVAVGYAGIAVQQGYIDQPFLLSGGRARLLNELAPYNPDYRIDQVIGIDDAGRILANTTWSDEERGTHTVVLTPGAPSGGPDLDRPTVTLVSAPDLHGPAGRVRAYTFTVRVEDDRAIDAGSIAASDFSVDHEPLTGTTGRMEVVSRTADADGRGVTVVLRFTPDEAWGRDDNDVYDVIFGGSENTFDPPPVIAARDAAGNRPLVQPLGQFTVDLPDTSKAVAGAVDSSMAYDASGRLHVAFYDAGSRTLKYATRGPDFAWSAVTTIDASPGAGQFVSLALDTDGRPGVAYYDGANADLKYAQFDGTAWNVETLDTYHATGGYPSLTYDAAGRAAIAYWRKASGDLLLARDEGGTGWRIEAVDSAGNTGRFPSLRVDPSTHRLALAWEDHDGARFKYAAENADGTFATSVVAQTGEGGGFVSLAFNPANQRPAVSFYDSGALAVKYAWFDGSAWQSKSPVERAVRGYNGQLYFNAKGAATLVCYDARGGFVERFVAAVGGDGEDVFEERFDDIRGGRRFSTAVAADGGLTLASLSLDFGELVVDDPYGV